MALHVQNIPNFFTMLRIILTVPIALSLIQSQYQTALSLFAMAGFTDAMDGFLARRFAWTSRFGQIADPLADKFLMITTFTTLSLIGVLPIWLTVLVVGRDTLLIIGGIIYRLLAGQANFVPSLWGKAHTFFQILLILYILIDLTFTSGVNASLLAVAKPLLISLVSLTALVSGLYYIIFWMIRFIKVRRNLS